MKRLLQRKAEDEQVNDELELETQEAPVNPADDLGPSNSTSNQRPGGGDRQSELSEFINVVNGDLGIPLDETSVNRTQRNFTAGWLLAHDTAFQAELTGIVDRNQAIEMVKDRVREIEDTLNPKFSSKIFSPFSQAAYRKLLMKLQNAKVTRAFPTAGAAISKTLYDASLYYEGNGVVNAENNDPERPLFSEGFVQFLTRVLQG